MKHLAQNAILLLLSMTPALILAAQQQAPAPHPAAATAPKPPTIPDAQKAAYWKAVAQQQGAQKQLDTANASMNQVVQTMIVTCGADYTLQAPNGDPECVAKPKVEPKK
jgi:hypothetical protein